MDGVTSDQEDVVCLTRHGVAKVAQLATTDRIQMRQRIAAKTSLNTDWTILRYGR